MHRLLFAILVSLVALRSSEAEQERLVRIIPLSAVPQKMSACPCEFDLGRDIDGETGLIIDRNGKGQPAFANIEGSMLRLENTSRFRFDCRRGEKSTASWRGNGVHLRIEVQTKGPGEESCWFRGLLMASKGSRHETRRIVGACGC
jgi:hypothetical protein